MHAKRSVHYLVSTKQPTVPPIKRAMVEVFQGAVPAALAPWLRDCLVAELPPGDVPIGAGKDNPQRYLLLEGTLGRAP